jgi:hypothetical protein
MARLLLPWAVVVLFSMADKTVIIINEALKSSGHYGTPGDEGALRFVNDEAVSLESTVTKSSP